MAKKSYKAPKEKRPKVLVDADFWHLDKLLATNADIMMAIGQRGNGKTWQVHKYMLEDYAKRKVRFAYIRRWAEDIVSAKCSILFSAQNIEQIFGPGCVIKFEKSAFMLYRPAASEDEAPPEPETIGYALALNQAAHTKSVAYTDIKNILFDEFIDIVESRKLKNEVSMWENTLSTLIRHSQDVKVFMLANTVSRYSEYFTLYDFDIASIQQGEIKVNTFDKGENILTVALEYCKYNPAIASHSQKYIKSNMINKGEWEIPLSEEIPEVTGETHHDTLLFSMWDPGMGVNLGCYIRHAKWYTLETNDYIQKPVQHEREFLVIKQTLDQSRYYHLTDQKSLKYNYWNNLKLMWKDIEENCDIDIANEFNHSRVFVENKFTADNFYNAYMYYLSVSIRDTL